MLIEVNNARLFVDIEGSSLVVDGDDMREKPVIVLVHGGPGADHSIYKPAYSQLSDIAQIIYYDHRGNGRSDPGKSDDWNLAQWGDDLRALCDTLGLEKPIIAGTSFGGFVALSYATRHPGHAGKLILTSTAAKFDFEKVFDAFDKIGGSEARTVAEAYWLQPSTESRLAYRDICVPLYTSKDDGSTDWISRMIIRDETALWFNGPKNEQGRMDFRADLSRIDCPVLVMVGEEDPITPVAFSDEIVQGLSGDLVTYKRYGAAGHGIVADQPDTAFADIRAFIAS